MDGNFKADTQEDFERPRLEMDIRGYLYDRIQHEGPEAHRGALSLGEEAEPDLGRAGLTEEFQEICFKSYRSTVSVGKR